MHIRYYGYDFFVPLWQKKGACNSVIGWGTMLPAGRSQVQVPMRSLDFFNWPNPSSRTMVLGSTQPVTEMSTSNIVRIFLGVKGWQPCRYLRANCLENVGTSTSHNPMGLHCLLQGYLYFYFLWQKKYFPVPLKCHFTLLECLLVIFEVTWYPIILCNYFVHATVLPCRHCYSNCPCTLCTPVIEVQKFKKYVLRCHITGIIYHCL
jgi:hypothetical protein